MPDIVTATPKSSFDGTDQFLVVDSGGTPDNVAFGRVRRTMLETSYSNPGGTGDRTAIITTQEIGSIFVVSGNNQVSNLVDGGSTSNESIGFQKGAAVQNTGVLFDFQPFAEKYITEVRWIQGGSQTHGTWRFEGSRDGQNWSDLSGDFTLGGVTTQLIEVDPGGRSFRYFRLIGVSGNANGSPFIREVEFKIVSASADQVRSVNRFESFPTALLAKLQRAYFFEETTPAGVVTDYVTGTTFDLSTPASQNFTVTGAGVRTESGVIRIPEVNSSVGLTLIYRTNYRGIGAGFLFEAPNGKGFLGTTPDNTATVEKIMQGKSFRDTRPLIDLGVVSGNWSVYHRERAAFSSGIALGGRTSVDTSRADLLESAVCLVWSSALTADELETVELWCRNFMLQRNIVLHHEDAASDIDVYIGCGDSMAAGRDSATNMPAADREVVSGAGAAVLMISAEGGFDGANIPLPFNTFGNGQGQNVARPPGLARVSPAFGVAFERSITAAQNGPAAIFNYAKGSTYVAPTTQSGTSTVFSWHPTVTRTSRAAYMLSVENIENNLAYLANKGFKPKRNTLYFFWSFGLNGAVSINRAPDSATYQGWLQDLLDEFTTDLAPFSLEVLFMRAHEDDPASDATALANVRAGTDAFIAANSNVTLLDNDGGTYVDGVHNPASEMRDQGITWHNIATS